MKFLFVVQRALCESAQERCGLETSVFSSSTNSIFWKDYVISEHIARYSLLNYSAARYTCSLMLWRSDKIFRDASVQIFYYLYFSLTCLYTIIAGTECIVRFLITPLLKSVSFEIRRVDACESISVYS